MGRKIPGKKHKGVKDPEKQREKRLAELYPKINAPPKNVDDQDLPKSLERIIKLKNAVKNNSLVTKKRKRNKSKNKLIKLDTHPVKKPHPKSKPEKNIPIFNQKPGESNAQFWHRVSRETHNFVKETEFETKFNVNVVRNAETGEIKGLEKKQKDELEVLAKLKSKHKNINKKKKKVTDESKEKLSKTQKKKLKILKKQEKKDEDDIDEFKHLKDKVEFGEIVHAPPELKVKPKLSEANNTTKVKCKSLLLTSLLNQEKSAESETNKSIDRTGKRKNLPLGERRQLEKQQSDAIAAYRALKASKFGASEMSI